MVSMDINLYRAERYTHMIWKLLHSIRWAEISCTRLNQFELKERNMEFLITKYRQILIFNNFNNLSHIYIYIYSKFPRFFYTPLSSVSIILINFSKFHIHFNSLFSRLPRRIDFVAPFTRFTRFVLRVSLRISRMHFRTTVVKGKRTSLPPSPSEENNLLSSPAARTQGKSTRV